MTRARGDSANPFGDAVRLAIADIARALTNAIRTSLDTEEDVRLTGGSLY